MKPFIRLVFFLLAFNLFSQTESSQKKLSFTGDFRFRVEHDWNSRKADGTMRDDRSRLRYRFRFGMHYQYNDWASFGGRIRSGNIEDQQGPHVTLGGGNGEFGLTLIGLEKLYFQTELKGFKAWIGKNSILMKKQNELFWNDNVFPEGIALNAHWNFTESNFFNSVNINGGHYIIRSNNETFDKDSYFQLIQLVTEHGKKRYSFFPAFYYFKDIGNIPDRQEEFLLDYSIVHLGGIAKLLDTPRLTLGADYYTNLADYNDIAEISNEFKDQTEGFVISTKLGQLKKKGDWIVHLYYAYLEKYAVVDYFAQNDWARWDYSSYDAFGSRLTNMKGMEIRVGYAFGEKFNLILRAYFVEQITAEGLYPETGDRIRLDLNIRL